MQWLNVPLSYEYLTAHPSYLAVSLSCSRSPRVCSQQAKSAGTAISSSTAHATLLLVLLSFGDSLVLCDDDVLGAHALEDGGSLGGKLAPHADALAILVEEEREGHASQGEEGGDGAGPVDAEIFVHVGGEEGESGAKERSEDRVGSED